MSTTFEVFPSTHYIPIFEKVTSLTEAKLHNFLLEIGVDKKPQIKVEVHTQNPDTVISTDVRALAKWVKSNYAWFTIDSVIGGTDVYFHNLDDENKEMRKIQEEIKVEIFQTRNADEMGEERIKGCLQQKHSWSFRRSAGQPGMVNLAYGFIASAFAELTNGVIFSDDGAWDHKRFPALSFEFDSWYFRPHLAFDKETAEWAGQCINSIKSEFENI
jgi:hypothetical protein